MAFDTDNSTFVNLKKQHLS